MENDKLKGSVGAPRVSSSKRRSSLFNLEIADDSEEKWLEKGDQGTNDCQFNYPDNYVSKLKKEVKQWQKVAINHAENRKHEQEDLEKLENIHFTEAVLSEDQRQFLRSIRESFQQFLIDTDGMQEFLNFCEENQ